MAVPVVVAMAVASLDVSDKLLHNQKGHNASEDPEADQHHVLVLRTWGEGETEGTSGLASSSPPCQQHPGSVRPTKSPGPVLGQPAAGGVGGRLLAGGIQEPPKGRLGLVPGFLLLPIRWKSPLSAALQHVLQAPPLFWTLRSPCSAQRQMQDPSVGGVGAAPAAVGVGSRG